jgi:hypothetical protein
MLIVLANTRTGFELFNLALIQKILLANDLQALPMNILKVIEDSENSRRTYVHSLRF